MAGDLEEFLKRAAERRAQKQGGGAGRPQQRRTPTPQPVQEPEPEVRESLRDRHIKPSIDDAIPVAEVVEPVSPFADQERRLAESRKKAEAAKQKLAQARKKQQAASEKQDLDAPELTGTAAEQLIQLIRHPNGLKQAFLLREILDRPSDRF